MKCHRQECYVIAKPMPLMKQTNNNKKKKREKNTFNSENNIYGINFGWGAFKIRLRILKNCTELKKLNEIAKYLFVVVIKLCHSITVSL